MNNKQRHLPFAALLVVSLMTSACNPSSINTADKNTTPAVDEHIVSYNGAATKGPLSGATISVYAIDNRGLKTGSSLAQSIVTDGLWSLDITNENNDILLIESAGGTYIDESDPEIDISKKRKITLAADEVMHGILIPGETTAAINFLTHSLVKMFQVETAKAADVNQAFNRVRSRAYNMLGFDPFTVLPTDPITPEPTMSESAKTYALLIGGGAYAMNAASMQIGDANISYNALDMLTSDYADCKVDGLVNGQTLDTLYSYSETRFDNIKLKDEVQRFRNNHYNQYENVSLPNLNDTELCNTNPIISQALPSELINLAVSLGSLELSNLEFNNSIYNYRITVPETSSSIIITPTADTAGASIEISGETIASGQATNSIQLTMGNNALTLRVFAEDDKLHYTYTLNINRNEKPVITSLASLSTNENNTVISDIIATDADGDTLTYSIEPGLDGDLFVIDSNAGTLSFNAAPDFEAPGDADLNNNYSITVSVSDGLNTTTQQIDVTVLDINEIAPSFVETTFDIVENTKNLFATVTARDPDSSSITYQITGGTDQGDFSIDSTSGALYINSARDFENPLDSDGNGIYEVQVTASDGSLSTAETISITVRDQIELHPITDGGIKTLALSWGAFTGADTYRLFIKSVSGGGYDPIGTDIIATGSSTIESFNVGILATHLIDWSDASIIVEAFNNDGTNWLSRSPAEALTPINMLDSIGYIKSSIPLADAYFGKNVAISADGQTMAVASPNQLVAQTSPFSVNTEAGAVHIFVKSGNSWQEQGSRLIANPISDYAFFGSSIDISEDGNTLVVGSPGELGKAGAAYVFTRTGTNWSAGTRFLAPTATNNHEFGSAVAINATGTTIVIGEPSNSNGGVSSVGAAYVYTFVNNTLSDAKKLLPNNSGQNFFFGSSLDIGGDGNTIVVSAPGETSTTTGTNSTPNTLGTDVGAVYVFNSDLNEDWSASTNNIFYLKAFNSEDQDRYGHAVAISDDGLTIAVGATGEDSNTAGVITSTFNENNLSVNSGAVYTYRWDSITWVYQAMIKASSPFTEDSFGSSVALNNNGSVLAVGAPFEDGNTEGVQGDVVSVDSTDSGAAYVYKFSSANWAFTNYVKGKGISKSDQFGHSISLDGSGDTLVVSAIWEQSSSPDVDGVVNDTTNKSGAVYVY